VSVEETWRNEKIDNLPDGLILLDGFLYGTTFAHRDGVFICADWETGEIRHEARDVGKGSLTWAEGLIYFLSEHGDVLLIRPNPEEYDVISRFNIPEGGEGPTWAHPVVYGQRLYIRHGKFLFCYDVRLVQQR
jgi:hypothetical protein